MVGNSDESLDEIECDLLTERLGARVVVRRLMRKVFHGLSAKQQGRLIGIMKKWCENPSWLTPDMFNGNEGRTSRHGIMVQAFKIKAVRLYGFSMSVGNTKTFVIADADPVKKQNKANQKVLNRAKTRIDNIFDILRRKVN